MDPNREHWNQQQQALRSLLRQPGQHAEALTLFLNQHAAVHCRAIDPACPYSFEDEVWQDLSDTAARRTPPKAEHSIAWMTWHTARCEDITMNFLVAGSQQVLDSAWLEQMNITARDTGNAMSAAEMECFNGAVDLAALREYRKAVARRTRDIARALPQGAFKHRVDPARVPPIYEQGAVVEEARGLTDYWSAQTVAGLLLMPCTRHHILHWNEAARIKGKMLRPAEPGKSGKAK